MSVPLLSLDATTTYQRESRNVDLKTHALIYPDWLLGSNYRITETETEIKNQLEEKLEEINEDLLTVQKKVQNKLNGSQNRQESDRSARQQEICIDFDATCQISRSL